MGADRLTELLREETAVTRYEPESATPFQPAALVFGCLESGAQSILLDEHSLPPEFFDLSTGLAGELVQKLVNYHLRLAAVVPDLTIHSSNFQAFARETSHGRTCRFFPTRQQAIDWLES